MCLLSPGANAAHPKEPAGSPTGARWATGGPSGGLAGAKGSTGESSSS